MPFHDDASHAQALRLARPVTIHGLVEEGDHRGRQLGRPTANVALAEDDPVADGVYAGWYLRPDGSRWPAAVSVGRRSTFYGGRGRRLVEAHLVGFRGDLVHEEARLVLVWYLRRQRAFASEDDLVRQIDHDVHATVTALGDGSCARSTPGASCAGVVW